MGEEKSNQHVPGSFLEGEAAVRNAFHTNEDVPEDLSLHGELADAADQLTAWSREFLYNSDSCLKTSVVLGLSEALVEIGLFDKASLKDRMVYTLVRALIQLDDEVEGDDSVLPGLTFETDSSEDIPEEDLEKEDASLRLEFPHLYSDNNACDEPKGIVATPQMQPSEEQRNDAKEINGSVQMADRWIRTEESANQVTGLLHANFNFAALGRMLQWDGTLDGNRRGDQHINAAADDGIVPDSQEDPDDNFEVPCTQMVEEQSERMEPWASIPLFDERRADVPEVPYDGTEILSGLHATADCDAFTHSVKKLGNVGKATKDVDGSERRRSKRLERRQEIKSPGSKNQNLKSKDRGRKQTKKSINKASQACRSQSSTPRKARTNTRSAKDAGMEEGTKSAKRQCVLDIKKMDRAALAEKFKIPPNKAGCSKCRMAGCRKCRGYTLDEYKEYEKHFGSAVASKQSPAIRSKKSGSLESQKKSEPKKKSTSIFRGIQFMVSVRHTESDALTQLIQDMGGEVADSLPNLEELESYINNRNVTSNNQQAVDKVLVATSSSSRTLKCIFARVMGIPIVSQEWVHECFEKNRLGGFRKRNSHVYVEKNNHAQGRIFDNLNVLLVMEKDSAFKDLSVLIQSLGGTLVEELDPEFGKCDLVLYSDTKTSSSIKAEIGNVERVARRLRIPSHPLTWFTHGIVHGSFNPEIPEKKSNQNSEVVQVTFQTPSEENLPAQQPPVQSEGTRDEIAASEVQVSHRRRQSADRQGDQVSEGNHYRTLFSTLSSLNDIMCPWTLETQMHDVPHGLKKSPIRIYFQKAVSMDDTVSIGDFVQLLPDTGEKYSKVAKVLALWRQVGGSGQNKLFGKFQRYYRFKETSIRQMQITKDENSNRVFQTDHIEDNVPLTTMISKCHVEMLQFQLEDSQSQHHLQGTHLNQETLYCTAMYDYETGALLALHDET